MSVEPVPESGVTPVASVFILGPSLGDVIEPFPVAAPTAVETPGRRQISFDTPATIPGGRVQLQLLPPLAPGDVLPLNIYAFFVQPAASVPTDATKTPDWFFKSGAPSGSIHAGAADTATGKFTITVAGVKPSLEPYHVQTVLEFQS